MSLFRVFVDGQLFYHPHLSQLSITEAKVQEDAENIDSLTLSAPFNHPYLSAIQFRDAPADVFDHCLQEGCSYGI